ncbi:Clan MH, family M20, peptidase T-like metallopeptidase [Aduncisulcus paluster]|uniref:Clan MH, family M20, peptidase T-like metallopeptidase n=1 Tax=Aduncisulcus paluster TaxID=2918883 RepID=A0ABQ5KWR4_9EUKA|nr:Clan MH, family M20, peptidase T-like metallopeptidase [Aduncisulcus paluster]|eukprot:gnl/Carplike_NY0171/592_a810_2322.p1 GENE.gnl/Carplike_NY0171/592_a810_2322~~gnl/Carplike_NY0171/592_a810_2322.p1  ORF type:complete len:514 (-),score=191.88 gnl/Carplike_NY0171/592_a810_2322:83-1624(-)
MNIDDKIAELAAKYNPLAVEILKECIRIPEDHYKEDPECGMSNHEGPRLEYLKKKIVEIGAVEKPEDVWFDEYGNIVWTVQDHDDGFPVEKKKVIMFDGHTDTVDPLPESWKDVIGEGIDCFKGLTDPEKVSEEALKGCIGWVPEKKEWHRTIFGRGSADQLSGVVSQVITTKILLELKSLGSLKNIIIISVGTTAEEDNDGAGPRYYFTHTLPESGWKQSLVPDLIVLTEGTGHSERSQLGIYRGQRGRMQIELEVIGKSCHGSMPHMGKNPVEWGSRILAEATDQVIRGEGILDHEFLGKGTRTASHCHVDTPSFCAVPQRVVYRFDRRTTVGETPDQCVADLEGLPSVAAAREAGLTVTVRIPLYEKLTWKGYNPNNEEVYMSWETPEDHAAVDAFVKSYKSQITERAPEEILERTKHIIKREPYVGCFVFSTDGVGVPIRETTEHKVDEEKRWIHKAGYTHPAMIGWGPGCEQNCHCLGECISYGEFQLAIAVLARMPSIYRDITTSEE